MQTPAPGGRSGRRESAMNGVRSDMQEVPGGCAVFAMLTAISLLVIAVTVGCGWLVVVAVNGVP